MGLRSIIQNKVLFKDVRFTDDFVLGRVGDGLRIAQETMSFARLAMGCLSLGAMKRCLGIACRYARRRRIATGLMIDNPVVRDALAEDLARTHAVEGYLEYVYMLLDSAMRVREEYLLACKIVAPEVMWEVVDRALQLLGGRGYMEPNAVARFFRDCRVIRIFEGPTEVLASHLGGLILLRLDRLREVLCEQLGDHTLYERIRILLEPWTKSASRANTERDETLRRRYQAGLLSAYALFAAVNRFRVRTTPSAESRAASHAAWHLFLLQCGQSFQEDPDRPYSRGEVESAIELLTRELVPSAPTGAGEDHAPDPLLVNGNLEPALL
jgi:hypothetical protein